MLIYLTADVFASVARLPFETRKQLVQMSNYQIELSVIWRNAYYGVVPLMARDVLFRSIILGTYYATTDIEHKPCLKYSIPQIMEFMRVRRAQGYNDTLQELEPFLYDQHSYHIKTSYTTRITMLIAANFVGTFLTNPIDVCLTKILTQTQKEGAKYTGLFNALQTVAKEEGRHKFLSGLHPRFMFNLMNGFMFLFIYDRFTHYINEIN